MNEKLTLEWYSKTDEQAERLSKLPPFVNPKITTQDILEEQEKSDNKKKECSIQ